MENAAKLLTLGLYFRRKPKVFKIPGSYSDALHTFPISMGIMIKVFLLKKYLRSVHVFFLGKFSNSLS